MNESLKYQFIKELIDKLSIYEATVSNSQPVNINNFAQWILRDASNVTLSIEASIDSSHAVLLTPNRSGGISRKGGIGALIGMMYRYAKNYSKKALATTPLQSLGEFTYLATLLHAPMTKTALIDEQVQEKTTGMAMIQRLIQKNWVKQSDNTTDGRSQIVELTHEGRSVVILAFSAMSKAAKIVTANLTEAEKTELTRILEKLETFHRNIIGNEKTIDLDAILEKYDFNTQ